MAEEKQQKPWYKKWWGIAIIVILAMAAVDVLFIQDSDSAEESEEPTEEVVEEDDIEEEEPEEEEDPEVVEEDDNSLSDENVERIEQNLHEVAEREGEFEEVEINIHSFEYDEDDHEIVAWVDLQARPDSQDDAQSWAEFFTHNMAEATTLDSENYTYDVSTLLVTQLDDDEFIHWTTSNYYREDDRYAFYDAQGMDLLD